MDDQFYRAITGLCFITFANLSTAQVQDELRLRQTVDDNCAVLGLVIKHLLIHLEEDFPPSASLLTRLGEEGARYIAEHPLSDDHLW